MRPLLTLTFAALSFAALSLASAQQPPQTDGRPLNPRAEELLRTACTVQAPRDEDDEEDEVLEAARRQDPAWQAEYERRRAYAAVYPQFLAAVPDERDTELLMPVAGVRVSQVSDTWGAARSEGRTHEGTDIFAPEGTPVYAATAGYVYRIGENPVGGKLVTVIGGGGVRYYYAHLSGFAPDLREGQYVTTETLLGYVGNTGNARTTPPHLHLGMYLGDPLTCDWEAENPYGLLVDREG